MNQGFSSTIIMGDFNAKHSSWGCDVDNWRGTRLNTHFERSGYNVLAPPTPTRFGYNFAITLSTDWPCTVTSRSELSSDHNPVTFEFLTSTHFFPLPNKRYTNMKTNWEKFTQNLTVPDNFTLPEANTPEDIDTQVAAFTDRLQQAYKDASKPLKICWSQFDCHTLCSFSLKQAFRSECGIGSLSEEPVADRAAVSASSFPVIPACPGIQQNLISFFLR
ncbi:RNA-directed DNA polymerase from mobile element jockey [Trichonephila clavipes]|nr:RNA-directed DNA polymerase from mobile element jockey [Trichonephila clavipes]